MPLQEKTLGAALGEELVRHTSLCRREAAAFQAALQGRGDVVGACTQESRLFTELAHETEGAVAPVRFVNIRETGGWSRHASRSMPKIAALLAAAHLPDPEPVATVTYRSEGRLLIIGPLHEAERAAQAVADALAVTLFAQGGQGMQERRFPVLAGRIEALTGWLGAFDLRWTQDNPIDLDVCTRCNACVAACPENAISLDYQVDLARCASHRECVKVCAVGAVDFERAARAMENQFDLVLDLRAQPAFVQHAKPQGYYHLPGGVAGQGALSVLMELRERVGEFEKPKFFEYRQKLCAHSRNETIGCHACIDVCSALAIRSDPHRQQIQVDPNLCVGCGACTTVCPTGALTYAYPRPGDQGRKLRTLLGTYLQAGGEAPVLLLHSEEAGRELVQDLGRAAQLRKAQGVPANVIPLALWHTASTGIDLWLSAVAWGASQLAVLVIGAEAPQYIDALAREMATCEAILAGLGYEGRHFHLLTATAPAELDIALQKMAAERPRVPPAQARFAVAADKRSTLDFAVDHLVDHAPARAEAIALPAGAPFGSLTLDKDRCTLCMSCVGACPAGALQDNPQAPQLRFVERNCVQCGLCVSTCPEDALALVPRLLTSAERRESRVLNEAQPFACIRCGKPFGTLKAIERMLLTLEGHPMFQGAALERLKMCGDCRVIDIHTAQDEVRITDS
jgi:ferredoxin